MHITPTDLLEPVEQLTPDQALAERERLRDDLARLRKIADEAAARDREIKAEVKQIKAEHSQARMDAIGKGEKAPSRRDELTQLELETEEVAGTLEAAKVMRKKVEAELHYLHAQQFPAFAEHAESLSQKAAAELEALRPAYEEVLRLSGEAKAEWDRLVRAHNEGRGGPGPTVRADGSVRTREDAPPPLSKAPACPLAPVADVFGVDPPRPPELEVDPE